jgi:hypothetical protein
MMLSKRYLETLRERGDAKKSRCAIKTALGLALDALESSEAGLHFCGELGARHVIGIAVDVKP